MILKKRLVLRQGLTASGSKKLPLGVRWPPSAQAKYLPREGQVGCASLLGEEYLRFQASI